MVLLALALWLGACNPAQPRDEPATDADTPSAPHDLDSSTPPVDVGSPDAATDARAPTDGATPTVMIPLPNPQCVLAVGAECDGREDCPVGQTCCGRYEPVFFAYSSVQCRSSCDGSNDIELCHPGEACAGAGEVCRSSLVIPYDFIGVCALPDSVPELTGEAVAGEIACGESSCAVGSEKCCLRARYDFAAMTRSALESYCAPLDHRCSCSHEIEPPDDGGVPDAGDAGDDDAG